MNKRLWAGLGELLRSVISSPPARREEGARGQQAQSQRHQQGKKNRRARRKAERDNSWVGGLQRLVDRMAMPTIRGDPLVRLKQFIEAAERDSKSTGKDKNNKRSNEKSGSSSGGSGSRGANAVWKIAAGQEEQDRWKLVGQAGKSYADVVKKREKQLPTKPEGLHASRWRSTIVDLADSIPRVATAKTGDHIIAGVAAEAPGLLVPDGTGATLIALPSMKTSHPSRELSAPTLCIRGVERVQKVVMLRWRTPAFPLAWKPTAVSSQVTTAESVTLKVQVFPKFLTKAVWRRVQLKPRDTIREMLVKLPGCGGDDIIDTFDFRKPDFVATRVVFIPALHVSRNVGFLLW